MLDFLLAEYFVHFLTLTWAIIYSKSDGYQWSSHIHVLWKLWVMWTNKTLVLHVCPLSWGNWTRAQKCSAHSHVLSNFVMFTICGLVGSIYPHAAYQIYDCLLHDLCTEKLTFKQPTRFFMNYSQKFDISFLPMTSGAMPYEVISMAIHFSNFRGCTE